MTRRLTFLFLIAMLAIEGCSFFSTPQQTRFRHQEDAVTVQVAVQSVAPFEDYISTLEPKFDLTSEQALQLALAQTQSEDSQILRELLASVSISAPTTAAGLVAPASAGSSTGAAGATGATSSTTATTSTTAGATPPTTTTNPATGALPAAVSNPLGALSLPSTNVDFDQALKFRAAAALLQEVSLLNHYVRDAAVRSGTRPYIVRMLVTVLPSARNEPYDAYTTVSFFNGDNSNVPPVRSSVFEKLEPLVNRDKNRFTRFDCSAKTVDVVPLLVTDDIESSLHSNTSEVLRDVAAAVQAVQGNTGFAAGLRNHAEDLDKTLNRNLNSIYAMGQAATNAIQVRLGAAFANGRYVTVARTYNISLLLLVKTAGTTDFLDSEIIPCPAIAFNTITRIRDAVSGTSVDFGNERGTEHRLEQFALAAGIQRTVSADTLKRWIALAGAGNFAQFRGDVASAAPYADVTAAWTAAVAAAQSAGRSSGEFVVDIPKTILPDKSDHFTVFDDGQASTLTINHAANVLQDRLYGTMKVQLLDRWVYLTNDSVAVGPYGRTATFRFPSVKKSIENDPFCQKVKGDAAPHVGASPGPAQADPCKIRNVYAEVSYERGIRSWQAFGRDDVVLKWFPASNEELSSHPAGFVSCPPPPASVFLDVSEARRAGIIDQCELPISYFVTAKPDAPTPDFTMAFTAHQILAAHDGTGEIVVAMRSKDPKKPAEIHFRVTEAFIDNVTPDPTTLEVKVSGPDRIVHDGLYRLHLRDLVPGSQVVIHAFRPSETGGEIAVPDELAHVVSQEEPGAKARANK